MNRPHPTTRDLTAALERFDREAIEQAMHTGRYRMRYIDVGTGPVVVMVHGLCDMPRSFAMLIVELLDQGFRVVAYDLPNGKDDDAKLGKYNHEMMVDDLISLLDHLQLEKVDILGTSFGSTITLRALVKYPNRFRKAMLQGGFARRPILWFERGLSRMGCYWPWRMNAIPIREQVMGRMEANQFVGCPPEIYKFLIECSGMTPIRAAAHRALILDILDLRPQLPQIVHPLLMIGGDRDGIVPRSSEADVEKGVPNVKRIEFTPCGHYPQYTMPGPMADEMAKFLRG